MVGPSHRREHPPNKEDRITALHSFEAFLDKKRKIRRAIEAAGIPHTFVSSNCCGSYFLNILLHPHEKGDDIAVYGSGEAKSMSIITIFHMNSFSSIQSIKFTTFLKT
jgi:hypothetical protein